MNEAPNKENAIKFLQLLLSPAGTRLLNEHGPSPIAPAVVSRADFHQLPNSLRSLVTTLPN
jgi:ABC-type Fe3+ transport system substrate-binding protein